MIRAGLLALMAALAACAPERSPGTGAERPGSGARGLTVIIGGDCSFARGVSERARREGWEELFGEAAPALRDADLAIVNLESPLAPCLPGGSANRPRLCGDPRAARTLRAAGVDAVTLANNHALDAGKDGLEATVHALRARGLAPLGANAVRTGEPEAESLGEIAVVAANLTPSAHPPGSEIPIPTAADVGAAVRSARHRDPDRPVLVLLHLGREMDPGIQARDEAYARAAVGAGAAAVVMHGAHVIRPLVEDQGVPVHLGIGNLLFDQRDVRASKGALLSLRFERGEPAEVLSVTCVEPTTGAIELFCQDPTR